MNTQRALRVLRPILTQPRRPCTSCNDRGPPPPCPPCESPPPPPCRTDTKTPIKGQRVVCCAPPQGQRPPCKSPEPECARTCEHQLPQVEPVRRPPVPLCGAARDAVAQRFRDYEEYHRQRFEAAAAERKARRQSPPLKQAHDHQASTYATATDGQTYAVVKDAPAPRCCPTSTPSHCSAPHPPPTDVTLAPMGDCRPKIRSVMDPCQNQPRTILTIDRSNQNVEATRSEPESAPEPEQTPAPAPPKPIHENPKSHADDKVSYKGITSRIMETLKGGSSKASTPSPPPPKPKWCSNPPNLASPPPKCRPPTMADRIQRKCPPGKREFHTSTLDMEAKNDPTPMGKEAVYAASKKLAAALRERDSLKEAGQGRVVRAPSCAPETPPPPPPPRPSGGAMEFSIPTGADTVCVRVSMGKATAAPAVAAPRPVAGAPPPPRPACPPPPCGIPRPPHSSNDSWLSIKTLQKKISSCGRGEPGAPASSPPARPAPPAPCSPQGKAKMVDVMPHTIFMR